MLTSPPLLLKISEWGENQEKLGGIFQKKPNQSLLLLLQAVLTKKNKKQYHTNKTISNAFNDWKNAVKYSKPMRTVHNILGT